MPNLLSQSKHEEFESNSTLQIKNQKERKAEEARKMKCIKFWQIAKFSQGAKVTPTFVFFCPFDPHSTSFFVIFSNFTLHVLWVLRVFLYFCLFEHYISSNQIL